MQYLPFGDWLIFLPIIHSRFIHVVACVGISFLFTVDYYFIVWQCHVLFIQSSVAKTLGLLPRFECCEYCICEHGRTNI